MSGHPEQVRSHQTMPTLKVEHLLDEAKRLKPQMNEIHLFAGGALQELDEAGLLNEAAPWIEQLVVLCDIVTRNWELDSIMHRPKGLPGLNQALGSTQQCVKRLECLLPSLRARLKRAEIPLPVGKKARAVLQLLRELEPEEALTGDEIVTALAEHKIFIDQSTLTARIIPDLYPYGVRNIPRVGYFIDRNVAPRC